MPLCWEEKILVSYFLKYSCIFFNHLHVSFLHSAFTVESKEENPMLGFRGASRYYSPLYRDGFALECKAIKFMREKLGFSNVIVMIPFCRTVKEADKVLGVMAEEGLVRSPDFKVYVMCEIPSNVILAKEFAKRFDGFSIGELQLEIYILFIR